MNNSTSRITLNIREYMSEGLTIFDRNAKKIGTVTTYELELGYMLVRPNPLSARIYSIPFHTVTHIDPREAFIDRTRAEVHYLYSDPPPHSTRLQERSDPVTGTDDSVAITTEPSGYDSTPVVVDTVPVGKLARDIAPGFDVLSSELEDLGTITANGAPRGQMLIRRPFPSREVRMLPTAFIEFVDRGDRVVYLTVSSADLERLPAVAIDKRSAE